MKKLLLVCIFLVPHFFSKAQCLSGSYTIGGIGANFNTIGNAVNALKLYGVCGPVIFNINDGIYNEAVVIDSITGSSAINTVIFQSASNNYNNVIISQVASSGLPLELVGPDNITFKSITLKTTVTAYNNGVMIYSAKCNYLTFDSVQFIGYKIQNSTNANYHTSYKNCIFQANLILQMPNGTALPDNRFSVTACVFQGTYVILQNTDSITINGNWFNLALPPGNSLNAINLNGCASHASVQNNYVQGSYSQGIYISSSSGTATSPILVANNSVAGTKGMETGIALSGANYVTCVYNSCLITDSASYSEPFFTEYGNYLNLKNNVFANLAGGALLELITLPSNDTIDYNIYYTRPHDTSQIMLGYNYVSLANYQASTGQDAHTKFINPLFYSNADLHYNNDTLNGLATPLPYVLYDIQGKPRNAIHPNPGAFEAPADTVFDAIHKDLIVKATNPTLSVGSNTVSVSVLDSAIFNPNSYYLYKGTIDTIDFSYKINNNAWITEQWIGSLALQQNLTYNFNSTLAIPRGSLYNLTVMAKIHSASLQDVNLSNNTLRKQITIPMSGTYLVGGSNYDFISLDTAMATINLCHETAPVIFSVAPGQYNFYTPAGSDTLLITSQSGLNTDVVLLCGQLHIDNLSLKKLTLIGNNYGNSAQYADMGIEVSSLKLTVDSCLVTSLSNSVTPPNGFCILGSSNIAITHNIFKNLGIGVVYQSVQYVNGASYYFGNGHNISYNTFDSIPTAFKLDGCTNCFQYFNPADSIRFHHNSITNATTGIYIQNTNNALLRIYANKITKPFGSSNPCNLYIDQSNSAILLYNNFLSGNSKAAYAITGINNDTTYPMTSVILSNSQNISLLNNSIYGNLLGSQCTTIVVKNNCFFNDTMPCFYYDMMTNLSSDYNNYYTQGKYLGSGDMVNNVPANYYGAMIQTIDSLTAIMQTDSHSVSYNPYYYSNTDLHSNSMFLKGKALPNAYVTVDIDNDPRNATAPDIGADEINLVNDVVWPGDANADSKADNTDLLSIGLYTGSTGTARPSAGNNWAPYAASNWGQIQYNGVDYKHADCDGNGTVNDDDTLAIVQNFNQYHNTNMRLSAPPTVNSTGNDLYFVMPNPKPSYNSGDTIYADIWLGSTTWPITSIYGIAFSVQTDTGIITANSFKLKLPASWLGTPHLNSYTFSKAIEQASTAYAAHVRNNHTGTSGYGKIASVYFVFNGNPNATSIPLSFLNVTAVDVNGNYLTVTAHNNDATNYNALDIQNLTQQQNSIIYPNPAQNNFTIELSSNEKHQLQLFDISGKQILSQSISGTTTIEASLLENGVYFIQLKNSSGASTKKIIVQH